MYNSKKCGVHTIHNNFLFIIFTILILKSYFLQFLFFINLIFFEIIEDIIVITFNFIQFQILYTKLNTKLIVTIFLLNS